MKRLLETLVVILMLLAGVSLTMGILLFQKRELLKGRTQKLEQAILKLATTVEIDGATDVAKPDYPARDIDDTTAEVIANPRRSDFWDKYAYALEHEGPRTLNYADRLLQLAAYYQIDPVTLRPARDPITGERITHGSGTMQELLDELVGKSSRQLNRLNETRAQLRDGREELVRAIEDINARKKDLRTALGTIVNRDRQIAGLQNDVKARDRTIQDRNESIVALKEEKEERDRTIVAHTETIQELRFKIARMDEEIAALIDARGITDEPKPWLTIPPGPKGSVAEVNREWNFVLLRLSPEFADQYTHAISRKQEVDKINFMIMRTTASGQQFVTKVNLNRYNPRKGLAVANILGEWEQAGIQTGDMVYF